MSGVLPDSARAALEGGVLCHLSAPSVHGPHLTPVVYVWDGDRLWLTTSRQSVKVRAWRRDRETAGLVRHGDVAVSFRGRVETFDALDPDTWLGGILAAPQLVRAAAAFTRKNARFFAGYAVDARRVPLAWTPPGRVFAAVDLSAGCVLSAAGGAVLERWGRLPRPGPDGAARPRRRDLSPLPRRRGIDLRAPSDVRDAVAGRPEGTLAVPTPGGTVVVPARWRRIGREGAFDVAVSRRHAEVWGAVVEGTAALTLDRASAWRAADMVGMLLRGPFEAHALRGQRDGPGSPLRDRIEALIGERGPAWPVDDVILVRIVPTCVVWWRGWDSGTVSRGRLVEAGRGRS